MRITARVATAFLAIMLAATAQAWRPAAWTWLSWPYAYDHSSGDWYYINEVDSQWVYGYPPATGWMEFADSGLANGWSWHAWPYAYDWETNTWHFVNETDTQWVYNLDTAQWSILGEFDAPPGMVLIPGGTNSGTDDPSPGAAAYTLTVTNFYMDRYEVRRSLWDSVRTWGAQHGYTDLPAGIAKGADHPVHSVTWYTAVKWCNARSEMEGLTPAYYTDSSRTSNAIYRTGTVPVETAWVRQDTGYRLPTLEEWEYAARGGTPSHRFSWSDAETIQHTRANYVSSSTVFFDTSATRGHHPDYDTGARPYTSPVGSFTRNNYGLFDMTGNINEWCFDWLDFFNGPLGSIIGGHWDGSAYICPVAFGDTLFLSSSANTVGFRTIRPNAP